MAFAFALGLSFHVQDAMGNDINLSIFKGKVLLIVNVASRWYILFLSLSMFAPI